jgi:hypothetical protein
MPRRRHIEREGEGLRNFLPPPRHLGADGPNAAFCRCRGISMLVLPLSHHFGSTAIFLPRQRQMEEGGGGNAVNTWTDPTVARP